MYRTFSFGIDVDLQLVLGFKSENIVFTDVGFLLNSGFTKILCTPIFPLCGSNQS